MAVSSGALPLTASCVSPLPRIAWTGHVRKGACSDSKSGCVFRWVLRFLIHLTSS